MSVILWLAIWAALFFLMMRFGCGAHIMGHGHDQKQADNGAERRWVPPEEDIDPVCRKTVNPANAKPSVFDGLVYYFCSRECREIFEAAPDLYAQRSIDTATKQLGNSHA